MIKSFTKIKLKDKLRFKTKIQSKLGFNLANSPIKHF